MMKMFSVIAALGALVFAVSDARADGSLKDTPAAPIADAGRCMGGNFSGAYIGVHLGGGSLHSEQTGVDSPTISENDGSFTIGEHSGYNVQCGRVLFGIESDFNYFGGDNVFGCPGCGQSVESDMNWFGTLRGRVGLVRDENLLIFATAGLAYAKVDHTFDDPEPLNESDPFHQSNKNTEFGWTAGGGLEFMRDGRWSLRADALYVDLGTETHNYTYEGCDVDCSTRIKWDDAFWVARVGLTYHFGRREAEVVPLK
jgi:outer membrane immunogenic protein